MARLEVPRAAAIAAIALLSSECSSEGAARASAAHPEPRDAGSVSCAGTACHGSCVAARCLETLAEAPSPTGLALVGASAYFGSCTANGGGVLLFASRTADGGTTALLAAGTGCPTDVALGHGLLFATGLDGDEIISVPLGGGTPAIVVEQAGSAVGVAADDTDVYFTTESAVMRSPALGGAPQVLAMVEGQRGSTRPALDATNVYWGDPVLGTITRVAKSGGPPTTLATAIDGAVALTVAGSDVFIAAGYIVTKIPTAGGPAITLGTAAGAQTVAIAADDTGVYYTSDSAIWKLPLEGGVATALSADPGAHGAIAVDRTSVYFTSSENLGNARGRVMRLTPK